MFTPLQVTGKAMAEFSGHYPTIPLVLDMLSDELLRQMSPVAFCGVDEINAQIMSSPQNGACFVDRKTLAPLAAELPCADADNRNG